MRSTTASRSLLVLTIAAGAVGFLFAAALVREAFTTRPLPPAPPPWPIAAVTADSAAGTTSPRPSGAHLVVATRNLFSPDRSETNRVSRGVAGPKPFLHGVLIGGGKSLAYLEDPSVKRVFGYRVGDELAGGRLEMIDADRVVISRPDGALEVLLRDPAKPRLAGTEASAAPEPKLAPGSPTVTPPPAAGDGGSADGGRQASQAPSRRER